MKIGDDCMLTEVGDAWDFEVKLDKVRGIKIKPLVIVIHYGVTRTQRELEQALLTNDYVSAHFAITARDGVRAITQMVPTNIQAGHAGPTARWRGRSAVNSFSIGIEVNNPGPLFDRGTGLVDIRGNHWLGEALEAPHQSGRFPNWNYWAKYTDDEIELVASLCEAIIARHHCVDVVGHDEIRTDKADPGPAFPMLALRRRLFPASANS